MKRTLLLSAVMLILALSCSIDTQMPLDTAGHVRADTLISIIQSYTDRGLPGVILYISDSTGGEFAYASGYSDIAAGKIMTYEQRMRIGSITKTYTAALILGMHERGEIDIESKASVYLSDTLVNSVDNLSEATVKQILNHTSGIFNYTETSMFGLTMLNDMDRVWTYGDALEFIAQEDAYFEPGTGFHYSNTNYIILGLIVETVTGHPFADMLYSRIISPFNLDNTYYYDNRTMPEGLARGYCDMYGNGEICDATEFTMGHMTPDGGIISTADDMAVFLSALFNGDILEQNTLDLMTERTDTGDSGDEYGLGLAFTKTDYGTAAGHSGSMYGYNAEMYCFPEKNVTYILLVNGSGKTISAMIDSMKIEILDIVFE
ncbi:MAG: serine hydrolase domain-containing protein [bacterium]